VTALGEKKPKGKIGPGKAAAAGAVAAPVADAVIWVLGKLIGKGR
jgi:hypothetical protein